LSYDESDGIATSVEVSALLIQIRSLSLRKACVAFFFSATIVLSMVRGDSGSSSFTFSLSDALIAASRSIQLLVLDVDGVLTDGKSWQDARGRLRRSFSIRDAIGLRRWKRAGGRIAVITSVDANEVREEIEKIGVDFFIHDCKDKRSALGWILKGEGWSERQVALFSADPLDVELMRDVGVGIAAPNAAATLRKIACIVTRLEAGEGAAAEACGLLLKAGALPRGTTTRHGRAKA
jgi:3-deoxy-D-manno-octulosonate 8-phosphate phosphatase (KDO 8-P phosphatase)